MDEVDREIDIAAVRFAIGCIAAQIGYDYLTGDMEKNGVTDEDLFETFWREYFYFHSK